MANGAIEPVFDLGIMTREFGASRTGSLGQEGWGGDQSLPFSISRHYGIRAGEHDHPVSDDLRLEDWVYIDLAGVAAQIMYSIVRAVSLMSLTARCLHLCVLMQHRPAMRLRSLIQSRRGSRLPIVQSIAKYGIKARRYE